MKLSFNKCLVFAAMALALGCQSKFNEQSPDGVSSAQEGLQSRVSANASFDEKLIQLRASFLSLKQIISIFRKLKGNDKNYTPIDLVIDLAAELKKGLPVGQNGSYLKDGEITLPIDGLTPACQRVDAKFRILPPESVKTTSDTIVMDQVAKLSIRSCFSKEYVEAFEIHSGGNNLLVIMKPLAFKKLFGGLVPDVLAALVSNCNFSSDANGILGRMSCTNLGMSMGSSESALLDTVNYDLTGETKNEIVGIIYDAHNVEKEPVNLKADKNMSLSANEAKALTTMPTLMPPLSTMGPGPAPVTVQDAPTDETPQLPSVPVL